MNEAELLKHFPSWVNPAKYSTARNKPHKWWAQQINVRLHLEGVLNATPQHPELTQHFDDVFDQIKEDPFTDVGISVSPPPALRPLTVGRVHMLSNLATDLCAINDEYIDKMMAADITKEIDNISHLTLTQGHIAVDLRAQKEVLTKAFEQWLEEQWNAPERPNGISAITTNKLDKWASNHILLHKDLMLWHKRSMSKMKKINIKNLILHSSNIDITNRELIEQRFKDNIQKYTNSAFTHEMVAHLSSQ